VSLCDPVFVSEGKNKTRKSEFSGIPPEELSANRIQITLPENILLLFRKLRASLQPILTVRTDPKTDFFYLTQHI